MGLHLLVEIRRLNPGIRLVLLSGYVDEHEAAEILRLGIADRVLTKSLPGTYEAVMDELARAQAVDRHAPTDWRDLAAAHVRFASLTEEELGALDAAITRKLGGE